MLFGRLVIHELQQTCFMRSNTSWFTLGTVQLDCACVFHSPVAYHMEHRTLIASIPICLHCLLCHSSHSHVPLVCFACCLLQAMAVLLPGLQRLALLGACNISDASLRGPLLRLRQLRVLRLGGCSERVTCAGLRTLLLEGLRAPVADAHHQSVKGGDLLGPQDMSAPDDGAPAAAGAAAGSADLTEAPTAAVDAVEGPSAGAAPSGVHHATDSELLVDWSLLEMMEAGLSDGEHKEEKLQAQGGERGDGPMCKVADGTVAAGCSASPHARRTLMLPPLPKIQLVRLEGGSPEVDAGQCMRLARECAEAGKEVDVIRVREQQDAWAWGSCERSFL